MDETSERSSEVPISIFTLACGNVLVEEPSADGGFEIAGTTVSAIWLPRGIRD